jgi:hypothetical protein
MRMQQVQQLAPARVSEGLEQQVGIFAFGHGEYASNYLPIIGK